MKNNHSKNFIAIGFLFLLLLSSIFTSITYVEAEEIKNTTEEKIKILTNPPTVQTLDATVIEPCYVKLNGLIVDDGGYSCQYIFKNREKDTQEWDYFYGWEYEYESGDEIHMYIWAAYITYNTTYEFQAGADNGPYEGWGEIKEYTTLPLYEPVVETLEPDFEPDRVYLKGKVVDDGGGRCWGNFRYRLVGAEEWIVDNWVSGPYYAGEEFRDHVYYRKLITNEAYEYQACAENYAGEVWGESIVFTVPNYPPGHSPPSPRDGKYVGMTTTVELYVYLSDPNGDCMDVYFYDENDYLIGKKLNEETYAYIEWEFLSYYTTYRWYIVLKDNYGLEIRGPSEGYWSFTTQSKAKSYDVLQNFLNKFPILEKVFYQIANSPVYNFIQ